MQYCLFIYQREIDKEVYCTCLVVEIFVIVTVVPHEPPDTERPFNPDQ